MAAPWHSTGTIGITAGFDRLAHGERHPHRVLRFGDGGVHQHTVTTKLHGDGGIRGGAHPGVDQYRDRGMLDDGANVVGVANAEARADGGTQGHHGHTAHLLQPAGDQGVVIGVHHHLETFRHQCFCRLQGGGDIRVQGLGVTQHLELDQAGTVQQLPRQPAVFGKMV